MGACEREPGTPSRRTAAGRSGRGCAVNLSAALGFSDEGPRGAGPLAAAILAVSLTGCAARVLFTRDQIFAVAGLPASGTRTLDTQDGPFSFKGDLPVAVVTRAGTLPAAPLCAIRPAEDGLVISPPGARPLTVRRADVVCGEAKTLDAGAMLGGALGISLGVALAFFFVALVLV